ncbi:unnamed protein product [Closterium sp. Naga37s-1]|nr:unnamed protein product [Closterium sp. Naga37s-1]
MAVASAAAATIPSGCTLRLPTRTASIADIKVVSAPALSASEERPRGTSTLAFWLRQGNGSGKERSGGASCPSDVPREDDEYETQRLRKSKLKRKAEANTGEDEHRSIEEQQGLAQQRVEQQGLAQQRVEQQGLAQQRVEQQRLGQQGREQEQARQEGLEQGREQAGQLEQNIERRAEDERQEGVHEGREQTHSLRLQEELPTSPREAHTLLEQLGSERPEQLQQRPQQKQQQQQQRQRKQVQACLDFGQKDLLHTTCRVCGFVFAKGLKADEMAHDAHHRLFCGTVIIQGWRNERVVQTVAGTAGSAGCEGVAAGRIVLITHAECTAVQLAKMQEIAAVLERAMGVSPTWLLGGQWKAYLYIRGRQLVGCLVAEPISHAQPAQARSMPQHALETASERAEASAAATARAAETAATATTAEAATAATAEAATAATAEAATAATAEAATAATAEAEGEAAAESMTILSKASDATPEAASVFAAAATAAAAEERSTSQSGSFEPCTGQPYSPTPCVAEASFEAPKKKSFEPCNSQPHSSQPCVAEAGTATPHNASSCNTRTCSAGFRTTNPCLASPTIAATPAPPVSPPATASVLPSTAVPSAPNFRPLPAAPPSPASDSHPAKETQPSARVRGPRDAAEQPAEPLTGVAVEEEDQKDELCAAVCGVRAVWVHPAHRRRGVATEMIKAVSTYTSTSPMCSHLAHVFSPRPCVLNFHMLSIAPVPSLPYTLPPFHIHNILFILPHPNPKPFSSHPPMPLPMPARSPRLLPLTFPSHPLDSPPSFPLSPPPLPGDHFIYASSLSPSCLTISHCLRPHPISPLFPLSLPRHPGSTTASPSAIPARSRHFASPSLTASSPTSFPPSHCLPSHPPHHSISFAYACTLSPTNSPLCFPFVNHPPFPPPLPTGPPLAALACISFAYACTLSPTQIAFSQPTESGRAFAAAPDHFSLPSPTPPSSPHYLTILLYRSVSFAYACTLSPTQIAFSQPTESGRAFAAALCHPKPFLVYK